MLTLHPSEEHYTLAEAGSFYPALAARLKAEPSRNQKPALPLNQARYFATNPAGCAELVTLVALLKAPLVVFTLKPEILLAVLLDT